MAFRAVARDLRLAGGRGPQGLRTKLRRDLIASSKPMLEGIKRNAFNIPSQGHAHPGPSLRLELMRATRTQISMSATVPAVRLLTDGKRMGAHGSLPAYMEGEGRAWRHPVFGNRLVWASEASHRYFAPAVRDHLAEVSRGVTAAVDETALFLARG